MQKKMMTFENLRSEIWQMHSKFISDLASSMKLDSNPVSCLPSIVFLICTFTLLYLQFHQHTYFFTRWKSRLYKDVVFHWSLFYITRIWFVIIRFAKFSLSSLDEYIEETSSKEDIAVNQALTHSCIFMVTLTLSLMPLVILSAQQLYRRNIPNFLMWIGEDPWVRSEMGISGHYLERPVLNSNPYRTDFAFAYRSKRSTSFDSEIFSTRIPPVSRPCKSMMTISRFRK